MLAVALWALAGAARSLPLGGDEPDYIARGHYFRDLFVRHDLAGPEWRDGEDTHTQPMLTNYIVGGWLAVRGYDLDELGPPMRVKLAIRRGSSGGRVAEDSLLLHAREPMVAIGAAAVGALYLLGRVLGGRVAGLVAAGLAIGSPLARGTLVSVAPDSPLALFLLASLLLAVFGARRHGGFGIPTGWALALGAALGLGLAAKLTAAASLATVLAWGAIGAARAALPRRPGGQRARLARAWAAARGWALALAVALAVFVLSNPHLYPNPLLHAVHLVRFRADALVGQQDGEREGVHEVLDLPRIVLLGSFVADTLTGSLGLPLEAGLAAFGAVVLLRRTRRARERGGRLPASGIVLLAAVILLASESAALPAAYPRYWLPTLLLGTLFSGVATAALARRLVPWAGPADGSRRG